MKKLIFTLAVALGVCASASAQEVGKMWVGGQVGFEYSKPKDGDSKTGFSIMPEFGYVFQENLGVGINVGYGHTKQGDAKTDEFTVAPFVRYSFLKGNLGGLFIDGGLGYTHYKGETPFFDGDDIVIGERKIDEFKVGFRPGVAINLTEQLALTAKFGHLGYKYEKEGDAKTNSFGFDFDLRDCLFGLSFIF